MEKDTIYEIAQKFFDKLGISSSHLQVDEQNENSFFIKMKTEDSGIIIGPRGKTLESIKMILRMMIAHTLGKNISIHLEINDYLESKESKLYKFVDSKIDFVEKTGKDGKLQNLGGYERKLVHAYVSGLNHPNIYTKSMGEGAERCLYICKKDAKITIDIDGDDI